MYEISCTLSAVSVDLDKHFVQKAFVLLDKSEVWNLRSIYGRFRPPGWRDGRAQWQTRSTTLVARAGVLQLAYRVARAPAHAFKSIERRESTHQAPEQTYRRQP